MMLKIEGRPDFQGCAVDDREEKIETLLRHCSGELVSRFFSRFSVAVQRVIRIEQRILRDVEQWEMQKSFGSWTRETPVRALQPV
jgi:hypothetical protein